MSHSKPFKHLPSRLSVAGWLFVIPAPFLRPGSLSLVSVLSFLRLFPVPISVTVAVPIVSITARLSGRCDVSLLLSWLRNDSILPVVVAEFLFDLFLNWHGNSREEGAEPVELHQELSAHLADRKDLTSASLHVNLLVVLEKFFVPIKEISRRCSVADVHEA